MITLENKITFTSARWAVRQGEALRRQVTGRKPTAKERRQINELTGRLWVAYRDLERLKE